MYPKKRHLLLEGAVGLNTQPAFPSPSSNRQLPTSLGATVAFASSNDCCIPSTRFRSSPSSAVLVSRAAVLSAQLPAEEVGSKDGDGDIASLEEIERSLQSEEQAELSMWRARYGEADICL